MTMLIIPSEEIRDQLVSHKQLFRFSTSSGDGVPSAALILKSSTLNLRYFLATRSIDLRLHQLPRDGKTLYSVILGEGTSLWSMCIDAAEVEVVNNIVAGQPCGVYLFNEANINVASSIVAFRRQNNNALKIPTLGSSVEEASIQPTGESALSEWFDSSNSIVFNVAADIVWNEVHNHYVTNSLGSSTISIATGEEGSQQEQLLLWLLDELRPTGAVINPQVVEGGGGRRELCDLLLTYEYGALLFESKTLAILNRSKLPSAEKVARATRKHAIKAIRQLAGAARNLASYAEILNLNNEPLSIERKKVPHCIVLVPELEMLAGSPDFETTQLTSFLENRGGYLQALDPSEVCMLVISAHSVARRGEVTTPMMAFDFLLMKRWERAVELGHANFGFMVRFQEGAEPETIPS